jgi:ABC-type nitrate/sulfonate/bicarbonate transport system substrate-binding protein
VNPTIRSSRRSRATASRTIALLVLLLAMTLAIVPLAACGGDQPAAAAVGPSSSAAASLGSTPPEVTTVTLIMDWVPWVLDIPVDVAQEKGFYADRGLTVEQILPAGPTDVVKFVSTGKAQFGLYYAPDTLMGASEGAPLLSVAALMSHAPLGMAVAPGLSADEPADLAGTTAGVVMIPSTRASFDTMLSTGGVDPGDVEVADPGFDLVAPLLAGKYDSMAVTEFGELVQADAAGEQLDYLDFRDWGTPDYAFLNVLTERGFAAENPATVSAFVAATLAGLEYAVAHPDEAVAVYVRRLPYNESAPPLIYSQAATPSMPVGRRISTGVQDVSSWERLSAWMVTTQLLEEPADVSAAVTNDYLPEP